MDEDRMQGTAIAEAPPAAAPPAAPPGAPPGARAPGPKRKRMGCLIALAIVVVLTILAAIGVAVFLGQSSSPEDVGAEYSEADFDSALGKMGLEWPELPEGADPDDYERVYSGSKPLDVVLTEAEISALMSFRHGASYWPIKAMRIDLAEDGAVQASGMVTYAGRDWAVSVSGGGSLAGSTLSVDIASAEVAGIDVPAEYLPLGERFLEGVVNPRLARIPGLSIDSVEIGEDGARVVGTIWERAEYVPVR